MCLYTLPEKTLYSRLTGEGENPGIENMQMLHTKNRKYPTKTLYCGLTFQLLFLFIFIHFFFQFLGINPEDGTLPLGHGASSIKTVINMNKLKIFLFYTFLAFTIIFHFVCF